MAQLFYNLYCYIIVGIVGNAIIGWELGKKGFRTLALEGPNNKKIKFALYCFVGMIILQLIGKFDPPFNSWKSIWAPIWGVFIFFISRYTVPRSQRLYNRAKFLHEITYTGDWHKTRPQSLIEEIRNNNRLARAEYLYRESLQIQESLSTHSETDVKYIRHKLNIATVYCQLSLLYRQQQYIDKAKEMAEKAISCTEPLNKKFSEHNGVLSCLSDALFRYAEIQHISGNYTLAKEKYEQSLSIDKILGKIEDTKLTVSMLNEIELRKTNLGS